MSVTPYSYTYICVCNLCESVCVHSDEAQLAEVEQMLSVMLEAQQNGVKTHPVLSHSLGQTMLLSHSLAMLWFLRKDHDKVDYWLQVFPHR